MATREDKNVETVKLRRRPEAVTAKELIEFAAKTGSARLSGEIELLLQEFLER